ncbi:neurofilament heavy polypeptide [Drosophila kikkawai]|uniref:Neurofilament heavy polypeptide n=1 Tax=Drosophila kikkawai TaxID=30033 RepID=A0A6P4JSM8_DROKI|nr:DNA ligase 1 [Drosophila kikkawai]
MAISKSRRGSCSSSRNTNRLLPPSPLDLHLGRLLFLALLASCSALAIETTEVPEVIEDTTILPVQIEESLPTQISTNQNETISEHTVENPKADIPDPAVFAQSSAAEVQDSFVSVYGGNLEQDIKNDVNIEVEEAPSPAETLKETASKVAEVAVVETDNHETQSAVQNAREPKTLETQDEEGKPAPEDQAEPEAVTDNIAVASEQVESRSSSRPLPKETSDLVSVILNEDRAITEQPITKTNLLALEQEHKAVTSEDIGTPEPTYEEPKHQVTKKQGVEDLLPIEVAPEVVDEPETAREERQFEEPNSNLNEIDGSNSEDEKAIPTTFFKSAGELQEQIEKKSEEEAKAEIEKELEGTAPPQETVVEAADSEDSQPGEEEVVLGTTEKSVSEETNPIKEEQKEDEDKEEEIKEKELKEEQIKEAEFKEEVLNKEEPKEDQLKEDQLKEEEPKEKEPEVEKPKDEQLKEEELKEVETKEEEPQEEVTIHQIDSEEPIILASPSSTQKPVEENVPLKPDGESVEDKDEEPKSLEDKEKDPESLEHKEDKDESNSDSSEETQEPAADEAKPSSSDDSTATPLVSYPPHDAGQTFDSNSADEHSAQLSGPSNYRSTLIIALCSGTAVIFIVASLVIFVVSFQRQHGTLDIEMQEQRLGKDDRDEEDAQVKLLEVDLSTPVIVSLGNEETDECL